MKKGYLFIANGRIVPREQELSLAPVRTGSFEASAMYAAEQLGFKLYMGINHNYADQLKCIDYDITFYNQHIYRNIWGIKDIWIGYKKLCSFLEMHPDIYVIHCNTPIGGFLGRICGHKYKKKVIYTAHGFHFFKGGSFVNRTIFKWIEEWMAHYSDAIITINKEDFTAAKKFHYKKGGKAYYVPGVGVCTTTCENIIVDKVVKFKEIGLPEDVNVGIIVGDLNDNKNVETLIKALPLTPSFFHVIICGLGSNEKSLKKLVDDEKLTERVHFLGYRTDVKELYAISDLFLLASKREGLPRSTMEAMCMGLPCIVSKIRGNVDLIDEGYGGYLIAPLDFQGFACAINKLLKDKVHAKLLGEYNRTKVKGFDIKIVNQIMIKTFTEILEINK